MAESTDKVLQVELVAADRLVWSGQATMVIARTTEGDVGILPGHAPMVVALGVGALYIQGDGSTQVAAAVDGDQVCELIWDGPRLLGAGYEIARRVQAEGETEGPEWAERARTAAAEILKQAD